MIPDVTIPWKPMSLLKMRTDLYIQMEKSPRLIARRQKQVAKQYM